MSEFRMPSLGADMDEGTIVEWQVQAGDRVHRGDVIAVVETEKSDLDVEIFEDAIIDSIVVPAGDKVAVGTVLATLSPLAGSTPTTTTVGQPARQVDGPTVTLTALEAPDEPSLPRVLSPVIRKLADQLHVELADVHPTDPTGRIHREDVARAAEALVARARPPHKPDVSAVSRQRVSPRARRLAHQAGIELAGLKGTGPGGAIVGADVSMPVEKAPARDKQRTRSRAGGPDTRRLDSRRRAIGALMTRSWQTIPQYHLRHRVSMNLALAWLDAHNAGVAAEQRVLPAALLLRAVAVAGTRVQNVNGFFEDDRFVPAEHVNLGVAVALRDGGLLTPTIQRADELTLVELMTQLRELVGRARVGRLRATDTTGATITVTNLGDVGIDEVVGVIFPPQVAIVGFGAIHQEAWAADGMLGVHQVVHSTLAADHRANDGRVGGLFLATIDHLLQEPEQL